LKESSIQTLDVWLKEVGLEPFVGLLPGTKQKRERERERDRDRER